MSLRYRDITWSRDATALLPSWHSDAIRMMHCAHGTIYVELRYLHKRLVSCGYKTRRNDFVTRWYRVLSNYGVPAEHMLRASSVEGMLPYDSCSVSTFVALLVGLINAPQNFGPRCKVAVVNLLKCIAREAREVRLQEPRAARIEHGVHDFTLVFELQGRVANWNAMLVDVGLVQKWDECKAFPHFDSIIDSDIAAPTLVDAVLFSAIATATLPSTSDTYGVMAKTLSSLAHLSATLFDTRLHGVVLALGANPVVPRPPLLRGEKRAIQIDPHSAFNLLVRARELKTVPKEVLRFNNDRAEWLGLSHHSADAWSLRELGMYVRNSQDAMLGEIQFSMAMDPSGYDGEDTMVSQIYSAARNIAANALIKIIPRGKNISINEIAMSDRFAAVCLQRKHQRWASYKEMRAVSAQIGSITRGRMSIDSFRLPDGFAVRRVAAGQRRVVVNGIGMMATVEEGVATSAVPEMPLALAGDRMKRKYT